MDKGIIARIAKEAGIKPEQVKFGRCIKQLQWDNCEGGYVTMANVGQVVYLVQHDSGTHSAYFDYGDHFISDYCGVDDCIAVLKNEQEADTYDADYRREVNERISRRRAELDDDIDDRWQDDDFDDDIDL